MRSEGWLKRLALPCPVKRSTSWTNPVGLQKNAETRTHAAIRLMAVMADLDCEVERSPSSTDSHAMICIVKNVVRTQLTEYQATMKIVCTEDRKNSVLGSTLNSSSVRCAR